MKFVFVLVKLIVGVRMLAQADVRGGNVITREQIEEMTEKERRKFINVKCCAFDGKLSLKAVCVSTSPPRVSRAG